MSVADAIRELQWLRALLGELRQEQAKPVVLYNDNKGTTQLVKNGGSLHQRSKHIDIRHHYIRELVADGTVEVTWIPTGEMLADLLTKPLSARIHGHLIRQIMS